MHKSEILRLYGQTRTEGLTLVPTKLYFKHGRSKSRSAWPKARRNFDKRDDEARKQASREIDRHLKNRRHNED
jgi:SsrA-binding protein